MECRVTRHVNDVTVSTCFDVIGSAISIKLVWWTVTGNTSEQCPSLELGGEECLPTAAGHLLYPPLSPNLKWYGLAMHIRSFQFPTALLETNVRRVEKTGGNC